MAGLIPEHGGEGVSRAGDLLKCDLRVLPPETAASRLATLAAPLPLDTRRLLALLRIDRGVDYADRFFRTVKVHDQLTQDRVGPLVIPREIRKKSRNVRTATPVARAIRSMLLRFKSVMSPTMYRSQ